MSDFDTTNDASDEALHSSIKARWGEAVSGGRTGFTAVPDVLLRSQQQLGLSPMELVVLLNVMMHWWSADTRPFPSNELIARRMGVSPRTVQRCIARLEDAKLIERVLSGRTISSEIGPRTHRELDLSPLVRRLGLYARSMQPLDETSSSALEEGHEQ